MTLKYEEKKHVLVEPSETKLADRPALEYVRKLSEIRNQRDITSLIQALKDEDIFVRIVAAEVLGDMGNTQAYEHLTALIKDKWRSVRIVAAEALGKIAEKSSNVVTLLTIPDLTEPEIEVRRKAARSLSETAVAQFVAALEYDDASIRFAAAEILGEIAEARHVGPLLTTIKTARNKERWEVGSEGRLRLLERWAKMPYLFLLRL